MHKLRHRLRQRSARAVETGLTREESCRPSRSLSMFPLAFSSLLLSTPRGLVELVALTRRHIGDGCALTQLQRANIGDDPPPVVRRYLRRVIRHRPKAIGLYIEEVSNGCIAQSVIVKGRRLTEASFHDHS